MATASVADYVSSSDFVILLIPSSFLSFGFSHSSFPFHISCHCWRSCSAWNGVTLSSSSRRNSSSKGVGRTKERQLQVGLFGLDRPPGNLCPALGVEMFLLQLGQNLLRPLDHLAGTPASRAT